MQTPIGVVDERGITNVYGSLGSVRHSGAISKNNPYYSSLMMASNNQDKDALFELAIQWEADNANLQEQRAYDRSVLEEQRDYDSPLSQVQRAREAGINMDLSGSSGVGSGVGNSSAQLAQREIDDQTGQTKFKNAYDTANTVFNGINSASSLITSLTGAYSGVINGLSQLKILPSQIKLNEAQAGLATSQAGEISSLLDGRKKSIDLDNTSRYMEQIGKLQSLLSVGFRDEEASSLFDTIGIPDDQRASLMKSIRGVHERPEILGQWQRDQLGERQSRFANQIFNDGVVEEFTKLAKDIEFNELQFSFASSVLKNSIQKALVDDPTYATNAITAEKNQMSIGAVNSNVALQNAYKDAQAWSELWDEKKKMVKLAQENMFEIKKKALADGKWTDEELGNYNAAWSKYQALRGGLSNEFHNMRNYFIEVLQKRYEREQMMNDNGEMRNIDLIGKANYFSKFTFDDAYESKESIGAVVKDWISTSAGAVKDVGIGVGAALGGAKGFGTSMTAQSTTRELYDSNTGKWIPQDRTRTVKGDKNK